MTDKKTTNTDSTKTHDHETGSENSETTSIINGIWQFLRRPSDLHEDDIWPCAHIREVSSSLTPTVPNGSKIPIGFIEFIATDFRYYQNHLERVDHISFFVGTTEIREYPQYWQDVLLRILMTFCGMKRPRVAGSNLRAMQRHLGGYDCIDGNENYPDELEDGNHKNKNEKDTIQVKNDVEEMKDQNPIDIIPNPSPKFEKEYATSHQPDLSKCISIFTNLFPIEDRPTGEEDEPFVYRLRPILDQLVTSKIPTEHQVGTVFSVLTGEARKVAAQLRSPNMDLKAFVNELKKKLLFDHNIEQRKIADWNTITYDKFRQVHSTDRKSTTACLKHVFAHFEDLPQYMQNENILLDRIRNIFRQENWCKRLFEKTEESQTAKSFSELLKTASSNFDRNKSTNSIITRFKTSPYKRNTI